MSDTPRTDAEEYEDGWSISNKCVDAYFARQLERELNKTNKELEVFKNLRQFLADQLNSGGIIRKTEKTKAVLVIGDNEWFGNITITYDYNDESKNQMS